MIKYPNKHFPLGRKYIMKSVRTVHVLVYIVYTDDASEGTIQTFIILKKI